MSEEIRSAISVGDVVIFNCDEYRNGHIGQFDGNVLSVNGTGADVIYLSGHRSRNDFIEWNNIIAKVDKSKPYVKLDNAPFAGFFHVFNDSAKAVQS